jgi:hypothetical protein
MKPRTAKKQKPYVITRATQPMPRNPIFPVVIGLSSRCCRVILNNRQSTGVTSDFPLDFPYRQTALFVAGGIELTNEAGELADRAMASQVQLANLMNSYLSVSRMRTNHSEHILLSRQHQP